MGVRSFQHHYSIMAADPDEWEFSEDGVVGLYRGVWQDSGLSKGEFLRVMKAVAGCG